MTQRHSEAIKWGTDYFIGCHISDYEFIGQIGDGDADHAIWDSPENLNMDRPAYSITTSGPGSDLAGETAAALAASSIWFRMMGESDYADECLQHAKVLFDFADNYRGIKPNFKKNWLSVGLVFYVHMSLFIQIKINIVLH